MSPLSFHPTNHYTVHEETMATLSANGIEINYRDQGDGPETVLFINGLGDDLDTWSLQIPAFVNSGYRVVTFDNRGVGASSTPPGPYTTSMFAEDTKAVVEHLGLKKFHLLGISMGGMIAQQYALRYPRDLASVTLACTYAAPGPFCSRMYALWAELAPVVGVATIMRDVVLWGFTVDFFQSQPEVLAEVETAMRFVNQSVPAYLAQLSSIQTHDTTYRLGELTVPTLVLAGEEDILIPVSLSRQLHALIPDATWATTPGGHCCIWEHPERFNETVLSWLARLEHS
jgi:3-oxoadipate enol-lactonase